MNLKFLGAGLAKTRPDPGFGPFGRFPAKQSVAPIRTVTTAVLKRNSQQTIDQSSGLTAAITSPAATDTHSGEHRIITRPWGGGSRNFQKVVLSAFLGLFSSMVSAVTLPPINYYWSNEELCGIDRYPLNFAEIPGTQGWVVTFDCNNRNTGVNQGWGMTQKFGVCPAGATEVNEYFGNWPVSGARCEGRETGDCNSTCCGNVGNPINAFTGNKFQAENVLDGDLKFSFYYTSSMGKKPIVGFWTHSYSNRLLFAHAPLQMISAVRPDGTSLKFRLNGQSYSPSGYINTQLIATPAGWRLTNPDGVIESYDSTGNILSTSYPGGRSILYVYSDASTPLSIAPAPGLLVEVRNTSGRILRFRYDSSKNLTELRNINDEIIATFTYVQEGLIDAINIAGAGSRRFLYNEPEYISSSLRVGLLTGRIDENQIRTSIWRYNQNGFAVGSESPSGINRYSINRGPSVSSGPTITDPNGVSFQMYSFNWDDRPQVTGRSQPAGSGCAASFAESKVDVNDNKIESIDFSGFKRCALFDLGRNLETTRVEGLSQSAVCSAVTPANAVLPAASRKVSTQWHPDWKLATKVAEPGRITTSVYNGQPDPFNANAIASCAPASALLPDGKPIAVLCKQVEQATTDANGALGFSAALQAGVPNRQRSWTYNQWGQVLIENGPRTDVNDTTTYVYYADITADHMPGDLQSVTNAAGSVTQYSKYNRHGQLLESTDPNGVLTVNTYDPRQRLLSTSVAGQTTRYQYDPAGQLKRVTLPDNSWVGYDYDEAHRQIAVYDNKGNRNDYLLDNAGNRIGENVKDPSGALKRQLTRSIDAIGRVQQITGRE